MVTLSAGCGVVLYIHSHGKGEVARKSKTNHYFIKVIPTIPLNMVGRKY